MTKLAWVPDETEETGRKCAIETRARAVMRSCPAVFTRAAGDTKQSAATLPAIPTVPQAVADALLEAARKLGRSPIDPASKWKPGEKAAETSEKHRAGSNGQASVIDEYNQRDHH